MYMIKQKTKTIVFVAILSAIFYLLSVYGTLKINDSIKFTFQHLPLYIAGILFGGAIGATVGTVGMFISQLLSPYGLTPTTILWVLPYTVAGLLAGLLYKRFKDRLNNKIYLFLYLFVIHLVITAFNTLALYVDSKTFGYYSFQLVFGSLILKIVNAILISILYTFIVPIIIRVLKKIV